MFLALKFHSGASSFWPCTLAESALYHLETMENNLHICIYLFIHLFNTAKF